MRLFFTVLLLTILAIAGCSGAEPDVVGQETSADEVELREIELPMGFIPDPQYAPFYVAVEKGYYAEEGLALNFDYSFETDGVALVAANERPFAIVSGEQVVLARAQDLPVVYVLEWFQEFPIAVVSRAEAGIEAPADLAGKTVGLPGFFGATYAGYSGLLSAAGLAPEAINAEEIGFTQVETLLAGQADAVVGYVNNEPVQLREQGVEIDTIYVADYVDLVANGIITNETVITEEPELVAGFVRATLRGLADTLDDPEAAYEISKMFVEGLDDSRIGVLNASLPLWEAETLGITDPASWEQTEAVLLQMGLLDAPVDNLEAAYTNRFVLENQPQ